jgi:hypothetical protein
MSLHPDRTSGERIRKWKLEKALFQNDLPNIIGMSFDYKGVLPLENKTWQRIKLEFCKPSKKHIDIGKSFCNYLWDTYGRIQATMNTKIFPVTSQLPIDHWHDQIGDPTIADAIMDLLIHNAHRIQLKG